MTQARLAADSALGVSEYFVLFLFSFLVLFHIIKCKASLAESVSVNSIRILFRSCFLTLFGFGEYFPDINCVSVTKTSLAETASEARRALELK